MVKLRLEDVSKKYLSPPVEAVKPLSLTIDHGEFFTLVGPSGCGKTTLLRMIAGLEKPTEGDIYFDEERVTDLTPQQRDIAMVFQDVALYPHMSVRENIGYGLKVRGDTEDLEEKVQQAANRLDIADQLDKRPSQLSGGQQQRVALGRAIVRKPNLILFDEPMSDLDAKLKSELRVMLQNLHKELDTTLIYVTHDQKEAMTMSTMVGLLLDGRFEQVSPPNELFEHPATRLAGTFIGQPSMNILEGEVDRNGTIHFASSNATARMRDEGQLSSIEFGPSDRHRVEIGIRPQHIVPTPNPDGTLYEVELQLIEQDGNQFNLYTVDDDGNEVIVTLYERPPYDRGTTLGIESVDRLYLFDPNSGAKLLETDGPRLAAMPSS